jgi:hypothetical protein
MITQFIEKLFFLLENEIQILDQLTKGSNLIQRF